MVTVEGGSVIDLQGHLVESEVYLYVSCHISHILLEQALIDSAVTKIVAGEHLGIKYFNSDSQCKCFIIFLLTFVLESAMGA